MNLTGNWNYPTSVRFGAGRIRELAEACAAAGIKRPLLVTDPGLSRCKMLVDAVALCRSAGLGVAVFDRVQANPVARNVEAGVAVFRAGGHDGVIAFGGGSALDCGKVIAFMAGQTRPMWDFEDIGDWWTRAGPKPASRRSSPCRRPPAPARKSAAPASSPMRRRTPRRSSSTRR